MKRLFFAIWPDEETRERLDLINQSIRLDGIRHLKPSNLHVTLVFLGHVENSLIDKLCSSVESISEACFEFELTQLEYWSKPKVLCLTALEQPPALLTLVSKLREAVSKFSIHLDERPYQAHATLARKAKQAYPLSIEPIKWRANDFVLVESISTDDGVKYEVLKKWSLIL